MIQIIGFLICASLAVKLLEMSGNSALCDAEGKRHSSVNTALIFGWLCVGGFFFWLLAQGNAFPEPAQATGDIGAQLACIEAAKTPEEVTACTP